jgi:membrane-associated protease RseP (regulator of RpoE activity)
LKTRLIAVLLTLTATLSLFADPADDKRVTRTVVVRDGKVITDTGDVVLDRLLLGGKRGYIGVSTLELTEGLREHYGAPKDAGVLVGSVEDNSPADKAGLKVGDIVISVDGKDIDSQMDLRRAISDKKDGESVRIDVLRGRNRQTVVATVAEREGPRMFNIGELGDLPARLGPEWRARIESAGNCGELQTRIKDLETRLKDLEKKLK